MQAASFAAVLAKRDDLLIRLHLEPTTYDEGLRTKEGDRADESPAVAVLYEYRILLEIPGELFPRINTHAQLHHFTDPKLQPVLEPIAGNRAAFLLLAERTEYRKALIQLNRSTGWWTPVLGRTTKDVNFPYGTWRFTADFDEHSSGLVWTQGLGIDKTTLKGLTIELEATALQQKWW